MNLDSGEILKLAVTYFEPANSGLNNKNSGHTRRDARSLRNQRKRKQKRLKEILKRLGEHSLAPKVGELPALEKWKASYSVDLLIDTAKRPLAPLEFGCVLYHLAHRTGYDSNAKMVSVAEEQDDESDHKLLKKPGGILKNRYNGKVLRMIIDYRLKGIPQKAIKLTQEQHRNLIDEILGHQKKLGGVSITSALYDELFARQEDGYRSDGLYYARNDLKSSKHLVDNCTLYPNAKVCSKSHPVYESFIIRSIINNLVNDIHKLEEQKKLVEQAYSGKRVSYEGKTIKDVKPKIFLALQRLKPHDLEESLKYWHMIYQAQDTIQLERIRKRGMPGCSAEDTLEAYKVIHKNKERGKYSLKAAKQILHFLEKGYIEYHAQILAGINNVIDVDANEDDFRDFLLSHQYQSGFFPSLVNFLRSRYHLTDGELTKTFIDPVYYAEQETLSDDGIIRNVNLDKKTNNPFVKRGVAELIWLHNSLVRSGFPKPDVIKVEFSREFGKSAQYKQEITSKITKNRKANQLIDERLSFLGINASPSTRKRYKLWLDSNSLKLKAGEENDSPPVPAFADSKREGSNDLPLGIDLYHENDREYIPEREIFNGQRYNVDHIVTRSLGIDSMDNLILTSKETNKRKEDTLPVDFFDKAHYKRIVERLKANDNTKRKIFYFTLDRLPTEFLDKHFNVNSEIARLIRKIFYSVCPKVEVVSSEVVGKFRNNNRLNTLLSEDNKKDRSDNRHHALDAAIVGLMNKFFYESFLRKRNNGVHSVTSYYPAYEKWYLGLQNQLKNTIVIRRVKNRLVDKKSITKENGMQGASFFHARGMLHKDNFKSKKKDEEGNILFYHRQPLQYISETNKLGKIDDTRIREEIEKLSGKKASQKGKIDFQKLISDDKSHVMLGKQGVKKVKMKVHHQGSIFHVKGKKYQESAPNDHNISYMENGKQKFITYKFVEAVSQKVENGKRIKVPDHIQDYEVLFRGDMVIKTDGLIHKIDIDLSENYDHSFLNQLYFIHKLNSGSKPTLKRYYETI